MRSVSLAALALPLLIAAPSAGTHVARPTVVVPNPNTVAAGMLRDGVLSLNLDATTGAWPAEASKDPFAGMAVFAERGKPESAPAPLIRVRAGTLVRVNLRNTLARPLTFYLPVTPSTWDSVKVAPGGAGTLPVRAAKPGVLNARVPVKVE